jgi:hypothetical protein
MLAQVDKGKTTIIIRKDDYTKKTQTFLTDNDIHPLHRHPFNKDCKHIHETLQQNNLIFNKNQIRFLTQRNPTPPISNAQLKLHKPNIPIQPVFNNKNAPTYKVAIKLNDIPKQCLNLDNYYITVNSTSLANDFK